MIQITGYSQKISPEKKRLVIKHTSLLFVQMHIVDEFMLFPIPSLSTGCVVFLFASQSRLQAQVGILSFFVVIVESSSFSSSNPRRFLRRILVVFFVKSSSSSSPRRRRRRILNSSLSSFDAKTDGITAGSGGDCKSCRFG